MITSVQNPKVKMALKLNERKVRNETGLFLVEGYRELKRAADSGLRFHSLFYCAPLFLGTNEQGLIEHIHRGCDAIYPCDLTVFEKLSYRDRPDGLIAIAYQMRYTLSDLIASLSAKKEPFLVVAEAIEKPGNLGTILRSADAAGVDGVIVCDRCTDIYNPNVVRASVGTLFTLPVVEATGVETLRWLHEQKIAVVATSPSAKTLFTEAPLDRGVAIAVGTEQIGLSARWMDAADIQVRIPMHGVADSLNVATATTLLLYEVVRQREGSKRVISWN